MTLPASKDHAARFCRERILSTFWFLRDCRVTGDALSWDPTNSTGVHAALRKVVTFATQC